MTKGRPTLGARLVPAAVAWLLLLSAGAGRAAAAPAEPSATPGEAVAQLYAAGELSDARGMARRMIEDHEAGLIRVPPAEMASIYVMAACLADLFHEADFIGEVDRLLAGALAQDPNVEVGPAIDRPLVRDALQKAREGYLASHGPRTRRLSAALSLQVAGPASMRWPDAVLPGLRVGFSPVPWLDIEGEAAMPIASATFPGAELRLGVAVRPVFRLDRLMPVLGASYVASSGSTWTHGLAIWAGAEVAVPAGFSFRGTMEVLRMDLGPAPIPGGYPGFAGGPVVAALSFPRLGLSAAWSF